MMSLETTNKRAKFETLKTLFVFFFVKGFSPKRTALIIDVTGPENILPAGTSVHLSARKFYRLGQ